MKMQTGDLLDRMSILILRVINSYKDPVWVHTDAHQELLECLKDYMNICEADAFIELLKLNSLIWDRESEIRNGALKDLKEVGRRAIKIRELNAKRIAVKNSCMHYKDIKISHASEDK